MFLSIVIPCYNEQEVIGTTVSKIDSFVFGLLEKKEISSYEIVLVDDGSKDKTWDLIINLKKQYGSIKAIKLSRNVGHQNALIAGLFHSIGDVSISIDADLQDDITVIENMITEYKNGNEIVFGVRKERNTDTWFKKFTAESFYKLMILMGVDLVYNHADYRLMSKKAIGHLQEFSEVNLFLRGIVPLIGYKTSRVYYDRVERFAGESKYPIKKMLSFAWDGITSFSIVPLRLISVVGFLIFFASVLMIFWVLGVKFFSDTAVPGWASTVLPIYFIGGIQLLSLGIVGEYIGKIYKETKQRPRYFIESVI